MKRLAFLLPILLFAATTFAQIVKPVKWSFETKKISDTEFDLIATAKLDKGWYIYSQNIVGDDGPIPTKFTFKTTPQYQLVGGKPNEVSDHKKSGFDDIFQMNVTKFSESVQFVQRVKLNAANAQISGSVEFMSCDNEKCLPPSDEPFNFNVGSTGAGTSRGAVTPAPSAPAPPQYPSVPNGVKSAENSQKVAQQPTNSTSPTANTPSVPQPIFEKKMVENGGDGIKKPVKWLFEAKKISETEFDIVATASIESGWHVYSQFLKGDGPVPTKISIEKNSAFDIVGAPKENGAKRAERNDPNFDNMKVVDFSESVAFSQRVRLKNPQKDLPKVSGTVEFMVCNDKQCLPPTDEPFALNLATGQNEAVAAVPETPTQIPQNTEGGKFLNPAQIPFDKTDANTSCETDFVAVNDYGNLWWVFLQGLIGGFLALLTPCVFPLLPMTVAFFTKTSRDRASGIRNAFIYAAAIIVIYVTIGLTVSALFGSDALNRFASNTWVNIGFGLIFLYFALSFFGYVPEPSLPSSWANKTDTAANRGGLVGIFFMAATLAIVSFSCTGPIVGTLLVQSAQSSSLAPAIGMFGFATALALPFGLFAMFPTWLKSLPKSGGWMDDIKVTLGFVEVALAFKFLSNADLAKNWKLLPYELFLALWILCALGIALYFAGIFKINGHKTGVKNNLIKGGMVAMSLGLVAYFGLGFLYNPVTHTFQTPQYLSGITPPAGYSYIYPTKCPLNIECFHDLNEGLTYAKQQNKPVLLDFTGYSCANCRKMENNVWTQPEVRELIEKKYVLISLYVDESKELTKPYESYISAFDSRTKKDFGDMWADLEAQHFNKNTQPYYVLLSPNMKVLNNPKEYTPDVPEYAKFLQCGVDRFDALKSQLSQK